MTKTVLIKAAPGALHGSFRRCGRTFTAAGSVFETSEFTKDEWDILVAEKMLHIEPGPETGNGAAADKDAASAALREAVKQALGKLTPEDFAADGTPKAGALKAHLPNDGKGVTAKLVAEVWAEVKGAGASDNGAS